MITFFTIPKPFNEKYKLLQYNAIRSWKQLYPDVQVMLFGDELGIEEAGEQFDVEIVSDIQKSALNTPFLDEVFKIAHDRAKHNLVCYINTDIILLPDFKTTVSSLKKRRFLMIGCRYDIDVEVDVFIDDEIEAHFRAHACRYSLDDGQYGSDYFLYTKNTGFRDIPNFIVGRPGWDNWMIYRARMLKVAVIDASKSVFCVHQNHDYSHVPSKKGDKWDGPEGDHNYSIVTKAGMFSLIDATHRIESGRLRLNLSPRHRSRLLSTLQKTHPELLPLFRFVWLLAAFKNKILSVVGRKKGTSSF